MVPQSFNSFGGLKLLVDIVALCTIHTVRTVQELNQILSDIVLCMTINREREGVVTLVV